GLCSYRREPHRRRRTRLDAAGARTTCTSTASGVHHAQAGRQELQRNQRAVVHQPFSNQSPHPACQQKNGHINKFEINADPFLALIVPSSVKKYSLGCAIFPCTGVLVDKGG